MERTSPELLDKIVREQGTPIRDYTPPHFADRKNIRLARDQCKLSLKRALIQFSKSDCEDDEAAISTIHLALTALAEKLKKPRPEKGRVEDAWEDYAEFMQERSLPLTESLEVSENPLLLLMEEIIS